MKIIPDKILVKYCKEGIQKFCSQIFKRHSKLIFKVALKMTGNPSIAEEMMQEAFLNAFRGIKRFREEASLKNWLIKIVKNKCIDYYRSRENNLKKLSRSIDNSYEDDEGNSLSFQITDDFITGDTFEQINSNEGIDLILKTISKLSYKHRITIVLSSQGYKYKEIAEMTGVDIGTVKSRVSYARKKLAEALYSRLASHKKKEPHNEK